MSHLQRNQSEPIDQLFQGILSLKSVEECYTFFSDLFTVQELTAFAQRFQVAGLLLDGNTYEMVRNQVPVSSSTHHPHQHRAALWLRRLSAGIEPPEGASGPGARSGSRSCLGRNNNKRPV